MSALFTPLRIGTFDVANRLMQAHRRGIFDAVEVAYAAVGSASSKRTALG